MSIFMVAVLAIRLTNRTENGFSGQRSFHQADSPLLLRSLQSAYRVLRIWTISFKMQSVA